MDDNFNLVLEDGIFHKENNKIKFKNILIRSNSIRMVDLIDNPKFN